MTRHLPLVLLGVVATLAASSPARADVVPFGWRPPPSPEHSHVVVLRRSFEVWMRPQERGRLDAVHVPRCLSRPPLGRTTGYGSNRRCADADRIRGVIVDRAVRFFAAELREAAGDRDAARLLRELPPIRDRRAQRAALDLIGSDVELESARALAAAGPDRSLEYLATRLGELVRATIDAGAPRERVVSAALALRTELVWPVERVSVRVEASGPARRFGSIAASRVRTCLEAEVEARWRPVAVRVGLASGPSGVRAVVSAPPAIAACVTAAVRDAERMGRVELPSAPMVVRFVVGPTEPLWGEPVELGPS